MASDEPIDDLLEEVLETNRTPEEVCAERPDLLAEVRARLRKLRAINSQLDSLFPPEGEARTVPHRRPDEDVALPTIPGYEVRAVLGRGGMGIVYLARHLKLNRDVALKMLLTGTYAGRKEHLRFVREAESVAALRHGSIVQIYEIGEVDGRPFFTMEYAGGGSLAEKLAGTVQPARESATLVRSLARAVEAAHACGIIHRDLKPANVLLDADGTPKITDFGLARRYDQDSSLTYTGARLGTPSYMAPEQMAGDASSIGPPVDVFALGAILYEMLTGRPPFRGQSLSDTERKLAMEDAEPPSLSNPKVPRDLETICLKCLEKDPRGRYASSADLADDLERFLRHEPIVARPIGPGERWLRWVRRNPLPTALAVMTVVLVGLAATEAMRQWAEAAAGRAEKARLISRFESGVQLVKEGRLAEARAILGKLGDGGFGDLRRRIDRVLSDLDLVEQLEAIGVERALRLDARDVAWNPSLRAARGYEALFERRAIGTMADDPATIAGRIGATDIKDSLIAALDDWAVCESDGTRRNWVLEVARRADSGAGTWEHRCRDPATWADREALARLAGSATAAKPSAQQLRALGDRLAAAGLDARAFRGRVQQEHVDSFLANLSLADALAASGSEEAIRYYQASLAIRPHSATAHNNLAVALAGARRPAEAIAEFGRSLELAPNEAATHYNLGRVLSAERPDEAIPHLQRAIDLDPALAAPHRTLGELFLRMGRYPDASASLRRCLRLLRNENDRARIAELLRSCEEALPKK